MVLLFPTYTLQVSLVHQNYPKVCSDARIQHWTERKEFKITVRSACVSLVRLRIRGWQSRGRQCLITFFRFKVSNWHELQHCAIQTNLTASELSQPLFCQLERQRTAVLGFAVTRENKTFIFGFCFLFHLPVQDRHKHSLLPLTFHIYFLKLISLALHFFTLEELKQPWERSH